MRRDPYRQYRRRMRRYSRRGEYPLIMPLIPYEPWAALALAAAGRWAYRHRSAFLPFAITGAVLIAAAIGHRHHPGWWIPVSLITMTTAIVLGIPHRLLWATTAGKITGGFLIRAWEACGINRPAERAYAAMVTVAAGGWLAAGIAIGPGVKPLPAVAGMATVILGIPWWAHRRRRARVRAIRTMQAWPGLADNMGLPGSRIASIVVDAWGYTARIILRKGTTTAQAIDRIPAIESALGIRPGSARAIPDTKRADRLILRVIETDPHAQPIPWPHPPAASITRPIDLGLSEDGQVISALMLRRNVLIGGTTGAGKSELLNVILAALAACGDVIVWGIDLKGGMELQPWAKCLEKLATTPEQATQLLADAITELDDRAARMAREGRRVWEPALGMPALIIVIDEYAELPAAALDYADSVARRGRAVAVNLLAATQRPTQEAMGHNAVRSQMDARICLRVRERRDVDLILGQGAYHGGWHAHAFSQPGAFLISDPEHAAPQRARGYLITDDQVTAHAARHARAASPGTPGRPPAAPSPPHGTARTLPGVSGRHSPDSALWAALRDAGPGGAGVAELLAATGMSRPTLYRHLREHARAGRVVQAGRGRWRTARPSAGPPGDGRPPPGPGPGRRPPRGPRRDPGRPPRP